MGRRATNNVVVGRRGAANECMEGRRRATTANGGGSAADTWGFEQLLLEVLLGIRATNFGSVTDTWGDGQPMLLEEEVLLLRMNE